ncbi:sigma-70 family RNA polymerase sigma factor [Bacteroidales bacterium OttesenSCG-928-I21]|nr:sigma-70 family RNA polymerase sigma factor [Bacteroidales bacterium OttesenSCG-928-I21]
MPKETYILIKKQSKKGLEVFYKRYGKKLYAYAVQNWNTDEDTAWDLIYKTYNKISEKIEDYSFESEEKFSSFVMLSFLNNLRNQYRDSKKQIQTVSEDYINPNNLPAESNENENSDSAQMTALKQELENLEDWERMLLLLKAQQMPYSEIAKYVEKPENQLKVYYARLKKKITENIIKNTEVNHEK